MRSRGKACAPVTIVSALLFLHHVKTDKETKTLSQAVQICMKLAQEFFLPARDFLTGLHLSFLPSGSPPLGPPPRDQNNERRSDSQEMVLEKEKASRHLRGVISAILYSVHIRSPPTLSVSPETSASRKIKGTRTRDTYTQIFDAYIDLTFQL